MATKLANYGLFGLIFVYCAMNGDSKFSVQILLLY